MDRALAIKLGGMAQEASRLLNESIGGVRDLSSEQTAGVYRSAIGRIMGEIAAGLLFPLWREHPDLEPEAMKGPGAYNPRDFEMPRAAAERALAALTKARELMHQVGALLDEQASLSDREPYSSELQRVLEEIDRAERGVKMRASSL